MVNYKDIIPAEVHSAAVVLGAGLTKRSSPTDQVLKGGQFVALLALTLGVPVGAVWHAIDKQTKRKTVEQNRLSTEADYYNTAAKELENELASRQAYIEPRSIA